MVSARSSTSLRVTFLLPSYPYKPVGGYRVVYEYANHLTQRGHRVAVVHTRQRKRPGARPHFRTLRGVIARYVGPIRDSVIRPVVKWHDIDPRVEMLYVPELTPQHVPDGDVVVATAWWTAEYLVRYPPSKGVKFYLIQHYETWDGPKEQVDGTWRYPVNKIVIARWLYDLGKELGVPEHEMRHIPNGIDHSKYRLLQPIESRPPRVAMLYHEAEWKGSADGIAALEIAKRDCPELEAVLFGVPGRPPGLPPWIEYRQNPPQDELVAEIYNGSAIYLCPSWSEGWHLPLAEAMACGCAAVSTDCGGVRDYAIHQRTALLAPVRDRQGLAEKIVTLLRSPELRVRLARAGREAILGFTWERATNDLESWMIDAVSSARSGRQAVYAGGLALPDGAPDGKRGEPA